MPHTPVFTPATRPNGTGIGPVRTFKTPKFGTSNGYLYNIELNATATNLDVIGTVGSYSENDNDFFHIQIQPALSVSAKPSKIKAVKGKSFTVAVTDSGAPVKGAKIKLWGKTYTTKKNGKVTVKLAKARKAGKVTVKATKKGYVAGKATIRLRK